MTDGEEMRAFFDEIRENSISGFQAREFRRGINGKEKGDHMKTYKLICTVTMKTYYVKACNEYDACEKLAEQLGYSIDTIDIFYGYKGEAR